MEKDFLKELKFLGVVARLKRLSETLSYSIRELYKAEGVDIEPSWHLVFLLLKKQNKCTMTEVAEALNLSQAAVTKMTSKMAKKGYLNLVKSDYDNRVRIIQLSDKARTELPWFEKIWDAGQKSIREILESNMAFFDHLEDFEIKINTKSFKDRVLKYLKE